MKPLHQCISSTLFILAMLLSGAVAHDKPKARDLNTKQHERFLRHRQLKKDKNDRTRCRQNLQSCQAALRVPGQLDTPGILKLLDDIDGNLADKLRQVLDSTSVLDAEFITQELNQMSAEEVADLAARSSAIVETFQTGAVGEHQNDLDSVVVDVLVPEQTAVRYPIMNVIRNFLIAVGEFVNENALVEAAVIVGVTNSAVLYTEGVLLELVDFLVGPDESDAGADVEDGETEEDTSSNNKNGNKKNSGKNEDEDEYDNAETEDPVTEKKRGLFNKLAESLANFELALKKEIDYFSEFASIFWAKKKPNAGTVEDGNGFKNGDEYEYENAEAEDPVAEKKNQLSDKLYNLGLAVEDEFNDFIEFWNNVWAKKKPDTVDDEEDSSYENNNKNKGGKDEDDEEYEESKETDENNNKNKGGKDEDDEEYEESEETVGGGEKPAIFDRLAERLYNLGLGLEDELIDLIDFLTGGLGNEYEEPEDEDSCFSKLVQCQGESFVAENGPLMLDVVLNSKGGTSRP